MSDKETAPWIKQVAAEILIGKGRCPICGWTLADAATAGCVIGNCAYRPDRGEDREQLRRKRERWIEVCQIIAAECTAPAPQPAELREALREALDLIWKHHEIGFIRRAYEQGAGSCELCGDSRLLAIGKVLESADTAATPQVTPDTQWIKPKFPATTPEEWREFGKTHFHAATPQVTPDSEELRHAVMCMDRSCKQCNAIAKRFGEVERG